LTFDAAVAVSHLWAMKVKEVLQLLKRDGWMEIARRGATDNSSIVASAGALPYPGKHLTIWRRAR
jgi:hypothetical protein